jgi:hypothetical protein
MLTTSDSLTSPNPMADLRVRAIRTTAGDLGVTPTKRFPWVYGVVMDWPINDQIATIISFCDGSASLYSTGTYGILGGIEHETVRQKAIRFVQLADIFADNSVPAENESCPSAHKVRIYLLTFSGVRVLEGPRIEIEEGRHSLSRLFAAGQVVLAELRRVSERHVSSEDDPTRDSEISRARSVVDYVNCLLTAMSEGAFTFIEIYAAKPLPALEQHVCSVEHLRDWVASHHFHSNEPAARDVIRWLLQIGDVKGLPVLTRTGELVATHQRKNESQVTQKFLFTAGSFNRWVRVELAPCGSG